MSQHNHPYLLTLPELITAKKKLGVAAAYFDKDKMSTGGFTSETLNPTEFKSQLRLNFNVELSSKELGAVVTWFDTIGNRTVDTKSFLFKFFQLGEEERQKRRRAYKAKEAKINQLNVKIQKQKQHFIEQLRKSRVTDNFSERDEKSALQKLAKIAMTYDHEEPSLQEFSLVTSLAPVEFREIMKRNCLVTFTPAELGAIVKMFGCRGTGTGSAGSATSTSDGSNVGRIDTALFLHHFFALGRKERDRHIQDSWRITQNKRQQELERRQAINDKFGKLILAKVEPATEQDRVSAEKKIRVAAAYFTREKAVPIDIAKCFESQGLSPTQFRELLKNNFQIYLSPGELDAAMLMFDTDGDGSISCVEFLTNFFAMGSREKSRLFEEKRKNDERLMREKEERIKKKQEAMEALNITSVQWPVLPESEVNFESHCNTPQTSNSFRKSTSSSSAAAAVRNSASSAMRIDEDEEYEAAYPYEADGEGAHDTSVLQQSLSSGALFTKATGPGPNSPVHGSPSPVRQRKPSVADIIAPDKVTQLLIKKAKSKRSKKKALADMFPKISRDTREFLMGIEEEEKIIEQLRAKRKNGKGKKSFAASGGMDRSASAGPPSSSKHAAGNGQQRQQEQHKQSRPYSTGSLVGKSNNDSHNNSPAPSSSTINNNRSGSNSKFKKSLTTAISSAAADAEAGVYADEEEADVPPPPPLEAPQGTAGSNGGSGDVSEGYEDDYNNYADEDFQ